VVDWCCFVICIIDTVYLASNANNILLKGWEYAAPFLPTLAGAILWLLSLEAVRRTGGSLFLLFVASSHYYPLVAGHMPGFLWGNAFTPLELVTAYSMGDRKFYLNSNKSRRQHVNRVYVVRGGPCIFRRRTIFLWILPSRYLGTREGGRKSMCGFMRIYGKS
jgi:hypothetical protein